MRYWREAFDFHSGAYRLDFWWVHIVNTFIFASILFVSIIFFNSWSLATKLSGTFSILITIPNLSLFIRRLRDTGFPVQTIMFVLMSPSLLGVSFGILASFRLVILAPIAFLIYFGWLIYLVSRRSAYWTPTLSKKQKSFYAALISAVMILTACFQIAALKHITHEFRAAAQKYIQEQRQVNENRGKSASSSYSTKNGSMSSSTQETDDNTPEASSASSIPEKEVTELPDDSETTAYRGLTEDTIGDATFGFFKVHGTWEQDTASLQWLQSQQNVMILTSTQGQGFGVDFASFSFKKITGQSDVSLDQVDNVQASRIDGTYQDTTSDSIKAMTYLEWHMPDGHIRVVYLIAPSRSLLNLIVKTLSESFRAT
ncbi:DUF805 domain-containing protein [Leuconostoc mesenteroides]|uniref:DUF805 domain-containing protein n=1 Tax=Leuconostoc mesenteroides TaxID=1245 RepID=UPI00338E4A3E